MELTYKEITINIPDNLGDITLKQYLNYLHINVDDESLTSAFDLIANLCNMTQDEMDSLYYPTEFNDLSEKINILIGIEPDMKPADHLTIDGINYSYNLSQELTTGEIITLNILREQYKTEIEYIPRVCAVLIRPATRRLDEETNKEYWEIEKFNRRDIVNLEYRAKLFSERSRAKDVMPIASFFLNTKDKSE